MGIMIHRLLKFNLKKIAAVMLILCLLLPLSKCTRFVPVQIDKVEVQEGLKTSIEKATVRKTVIYYPLSSFRFSNFESWLALFAFIWPIVLLIISSSSKKHLFLVFIQILELACCCYTTFFLYFAVLLRVPMVGAYITLLAIILYSISIFYSFGYWIKIKYQD
jgi:hypothetical protein